MKTERSTTNILLLFYFYQNEKKNQADIEFAALVELLRTF